MSDDVWHTIWSAALSLIAFLGGLAIKNNNARLDSHDRKIDENENRIWALDRVVAGQYITREEFTERMEALEGRINVRLQRIENKLDR